MLLQRRRACRRGVQTYRLVPRDAVVICCCCRHRQGIREQRARVARDLRPPRLRERWFAGSHTLVKCVLPVSHVASMKGAVSMDVEMWKVEGRSRRRDDVAVVAARCCVCRRPPVAGGGCVVRRPVPVVALWQPRPSPTLVVRRDYCYGLPTPTMSSVVSLIVILKYSHG